MPDNIDTFGTLRRIVQDMQKYNKNVGCNIIDPDIIEHIDIEQYCNKPEDNIKMITKKVKQLVRLNGDVTDMDNIFLKLSANKLFVFMFGVSLLLLYFVLGRIISFICYVSEIFIFTTMPIKIAIHVLSTDSDLKQNIENMITKTSDIKELKKVYRQARKIKRIRMDYGGTLLRQTLVVLLIKIMITIICMFDTVPLIGFFSNGVYMFFLFLMILIQTPVMITNLLINNLAKKLNIKQHNMCLTQPISDNIILWIKGLIGDSKLASVREIRDINLKYDECSTLLVEDIEKLFNALSNLGISNSKNMIL